MASFTKGPGYRDPFGNHNFLRSTKGIKTGSVTFAHETLPFETIDGVPARVLRKGEVIAKITSGPHADKYGVFHAAGTAEVQTLTEGVAITAGSFDLTIPDVGSDGSDVTLEDVAFGITAANLTIDVNAALAAAESDLTVVVTGGPVATTPLTFTFKDEDGVGQDVGLMTSVQTGLTGTFTHGTGTPGVDGATDGRQTLTNIVGLNNTYLPWQLLERDVEIAILVECSAVQANCYERDAAGDRIALTDTTAAAMFAKKHIDVRFPTS